jgi:condensin-2 complex subunit H2
MSLHHCNSGHPLRVNGRQFETRQMEREKRYGSLLQPIRDLTENWDVDIAHLLEDYLDDLDEIRLSIPDTIHGKQENLNFAEAALVIQGSTAIYSKKVEYLHNLVLQALELISHQKNEKKVFA